MELTYDLDGTRKDLLPLLMSTRGMHTGRCVVDIEFVFCNVVLFC